jgi:hypothetical protein
MQFLTEINIQHQYRSIGMVVLMFLELFKAGVGLQK